MRTITLPVIVGSMAMVLAAAACGGSSTTPPAVTAATTTTVERPSQVVDELVSIHDGRLHLRCVGSGATTVLLLAGWGGGGDTWGAVEPAISEQARVCSYARFGTGASDAPRSTQTFDSQVADLHELLGAAGEPGPYVVLGHSFGGAEAVTFAATYPNEVAGLVLLDATPTGWPVAVCSTPAYEAGCAVMRDPSLDPERVDVFPAFEAVAAITSLGDLPLTVVTAEHRDGQGLSAGERARLDALWAAGMADWADLSSSSTVVTVGGTGHHIELDRPDAVVAEVVRLLR